MGHRRSWKRGREENDTYIKFKKKLKSTRKRKQSKNVQSSSFSHVISELSGKMKTAE